MISSRTNLFLREFYKRSAWSCRLCSTISKQEESADPAPLFFSKDVQQILKTLTRIDYKRAFRVRKDGTKLSPPEYKFMTDQELEDFQKEAMAKVDTRIQMPPVVKTQQNTAKVIAETPELEGYDESKYVFTDISYGGCNRDRLIVVRDLDGSLRHVNQLERNRMNQVYFPIPGRELHVPKMFYDPYFKDLLDREEYEFILDRACTQFEPDELEYERITKEVYFCVNAGKKFDLLRSTRHFGPLAFHLAWQGNIDNLLVDVIQGGRIDEAVSLIRLYHRIHPEAKSAAPVEDEGSIALIDRYAKLDSAQRNNVEHAVLMYEKLEKEKQEVEEGIKKAHGLDATAAQPETVK